MNLDQIETKCFILALFIRDDGERFLLGSRAYEFVDSQLHFAANSYQNDVVEVQGNDGLMLAGQVRRATSQAFDGYIGDQTVDRATIEQYRRDFMKFFRKNHYYKVVYVFPDGTAVQRRNGFIVEAPEVKELYQLFPKYHVSMNFEDINYYNYEEDSEGEEIYGESAALKIATAATGGLIWSNSSSATLTGEGTNFTLEGTVNGNAISDAQLKGDTTQQIYSGKNLVDVASMTGKTYSGLTTTVNSDGTLSISGTASDTWGDFTADMPIDLENGGTYTLSIGNALPFNFVGYVGATRQNFSIEAGQTSVTLTMNSDKDSIHFYGSGFTVNQSYNVTVTNIQLEKSSTATTYEPYVGGIPAPNPDYPQTVNTVTGRQVVTISDGDSHSQEYEVNLGKNLFDKNSPNLFAGIVNYSTGKIQSNANNEVLYIEISGGETYTVSKVLSDGFTLGTTANIPTNDEPVIDKIQNNSATSLTLATSYNAKYLCVHFWRSSDTHTQQEIMDSIQIELGSTATSYAPYFEPIELCKIGDYQDYIYQSGSDWYVHKETGKIVLGYSQIWSNLNAKTNYILFETYDVTLLPTSTADVVPAFSDKFTVYSNDILYREDSTSGLCASSNGYLRLNMSKTAAAGINSMRTWCENNTPTIYYALATATDTQITNADLVSQLNALAGATTYDDKTVFTVTSENQLAILSLSTIGSGGGGVVWDQDGAEWEEGTGGGPTMISVDSIDNVYPVLTLTGPAVNPQISVITTNTTLSYAGTVTSSQELKIDMFNKTATLNGVSVIGNVSGDWIYLKPGINRVTYATNNANTPDATIWWQEIVG